MADALDDLAGWASPLLENLGPAARKAAMAEIAQALQRSQNHRIADQRNPDGSPFDPRKPRSRDKAGRIKRMFEGLRKARYLKRSATTSTATVSFAPYVSRTARVHQLGLRDRVDFRNPKSPEVRYARRELLGVTDADRDLIADIILKHATGGA